MKPDPNNDFNIKKEIENEDWETRDKTLTTKDEARNQK
jgi:hypothetical protein